MLITRNPNNNKKAELKTDFREFKVPNKNMNKKSNRTKTRPNNREANKNKQFAPIKMTLWHTLNYKTR
jgi:hypothetical protein